MTLAWIKDPLAILADGAERGVVVSGGQIAELVTAGGTSASQDLAVLDAGTYVVGATDRALFPWLQALSPIWAWLTSEALDAAVTVAMTELLLSGCAATTDHQYVVPTGLETAIDIEVVGAALGIRADRVMVAGH